MSWFIYTFILLLMLYGIGMTFLASYVWTFNKRKYSLLEEENDLLIFWLQKKLDGIDIQKFLDDKGIHSIAFYKFTPISEMLCLELEKYVEIKYCIDENADNIWEGMENVPIIKPEDVDMQNIADLLILAHNREKSLPVNMIEKFEETSIVMWTNEIIREL